MAAAWRVQGASLSRIFNVWQVLVDKRAFAVTPAHLLASHLPHHHHHLFQTAELKRLRAAYDWRVPCDYSPRSFERNLAWARLPKDAIKAPICLEIDVKHLGRSHNARVCFRQVVDRYGQWVVAAGETSEIGIVGSVTLYPSPRSQLLEVVNLGHDSLSGALVLRDRTERALGLVLQAALSPAASSVAVAPCRHWSTQERLVWLEQRMQDDSSCCRQVIRRSIVMPGAHIKGLMAKPSRPLQDFIIVPQ